MSDLAALIPSLKTAVAVPGGFAAAFPESDDGLLTQMLVDAAAVCQRDRVLNGFALDVDAHTISPDLNPAQGALVVLWAQITLTRSLLMNRPTKRTYSAAGASVDTEFAATVLVEILKEATAQKTAVIQAVSDEDESVSFGMVDSYRVRDLAAYGPPWHGSDYYGGL